MLSLFDLLDKYMIDNNITVIDDVNKYIGFYYECLPEYINQAVLYASREMDMDNQFSHGREKYHLKRNFQGDLIITMRTDNGDGILIVAKDSEKVSTFGNTKVISEREILEYAYYLQKHRLKQLELRDLISIKYPKLDRLSRLKIEYKIMYRDMIKDLTELKNNGINILQNVDYDDIISDMFNNIVPYIDRSENVYREELSHSNKTIDISFMPRTDDGEGRGYGVRQLGGTASERTNAIIPEYARKKVLESYPNELIFQGMAVSEDIDVTDYMCYLYRIGKRKFALILEPVSGISYTKMVGIDATWMDRDEFMKVLKKYLELSLRETFDYDNIVRTGHTTLELYEDNIRYLITGKTNGLVNSYTKEKIDKIR